MSQIKQYGKVAITFEGEFDQNKSYEKLCVVEYAGMSFLSKVDGTTSIPTQNKDEWLQLSVQGEKGEKGDVGDKGDKGDKGDIGTKGISTRTIFVYKHSETIPDKPIGGSVDFVGGAVVYPEGWQASDNIKSPVWRSERTFFEDNSLQDEWSTPMKITGDDGKAGVDGVNMEFIYKITKRPTIVPDISNMPSENVNDYVPVEFGWSDRPNGVSPTNRIEWVCTRKKVNGVWSNWEGPTIWSAYGEKGQDGDGVEYIFYIDNTGNTPSNPTPSDWEYNDEYQNPDKEYVPTELGWTDVATGISENKRFEWQCSRKFRNGFWQPFEGPYLWSKYGDKGTIGDKIIEMYAVTDDHEAPIVNKNNINPGSIWSIAPPETFDPSTGGAIWKIYTYVDYKNEFVEWQTIENDETTKHIGWSDPIIQTGYNGKDGISPNWRTYIYKQSDEKPELPTFTDPTKFEEAGWKDAPYNDVDGDGSVDIKGRWWECSGLVNGESGEVEWQYIREINGSNSKALFQVTTSRVQPECNKTNNNPGNLWKETYDIPNIYQYVWMITAQFDTQGNIVGEWQGPTCITGETPKIEENGDVTIGGEKTGVNILNLHLELDNDSETIPTNSEGNAIGTVSAITTAQLYNGSKLITEGVIYSAVATKCTLKESENTTGIFEVIALSSGTDITGYYVEITATYKNIGISKKFNISKSLGIKTYKIECSRSVLNPDILYPIDFSHVKIKDIENNSYIYNLEYAGLTLLINNKEVEIDPNTGVYIVIGGEYVLDGKIDIVLKKGDDILDKENIGLVKNGNSIKIKGSLNSIDELPDVPNDESDCYVIGLDIYCWNGINWFNAGQFKGVDGKAPKISDDGYWMFWNGTNYQKTEFYAIGDGHLPFIEDGYWWEWDSTTKSYKNTNIRAEGVDGVTPTIGEDGYWYFNGVKSEYSAIGDDGHSPYIGENGNWYEWDPVTKNYIDTRIPAEGELSVNHPKIINGYWYIYNVETQSYENSGVSAEGKTQVINPRHKLICDVTEIVSCNPGGGYWSLIDGRTFPAMISISYPDRSYIPFYLYDGKDKMPIAIDSVNIYIDNDNFAKPVADEIMIQTNDDNTECSFKALFYPKDSLDVNEYYNMLENGINLIISVKYNTYEVKTSIKILLTQKNETKYSIYFLKRFLIEDNIGVNNLSLAARLIENYQENEDRSDIKYSSNPIIYLGTENNYKEYLCESSFGGLCTIDSSKLTEDRIIISAFVDDILVAVSRLYIIRENYNTYYLHIAYSNNEDGSNYTQYLADAKYIGVYTGLISDFNDLTKENFKWSLFRGNDGAKGLSGIPGVSLYLRYWYGNSLNVSSDAPIDRTQWYINPKDIIPTDTNPYIWFVQGEKTYNRNGDGNNFIETITWTDPVLLSGVTSLDKIKDKVNRKIIYPDGLYGAKESYICTDRKAPYVLDSQDGNYYVYLKTTIWNVADQTLIPSTDYSNNKPLGTNSWEKFEIFEAIYSGIGVFGNALVGSAVFNGDYMFSQQGIDENGNTNNDYENFNPDNPFDENNNFYPNVCINFKKGIFSLGKNKLFELSEDGTLNIGNFKWDDKGNQLPNKLDTTIQLTSEDTSYTPSLHQNENLYLGIAGINSFTLNLPNFLNINNMSGKDGYLCSVILYNYQAYISSGPNSDISVTIKTGFFSLNNEQEIVYNIKPGRYVTIHYYKFNKNSNNICALLPNLSVN